MIYFDICMISSSDFVTRQWINVNYSYSFHNLNESKTTHKKKFFLQLAGFMTSYSFLYVLCWISGYNKFPWSSLAVHRLILSFLILLSSYVQFGVLVCWSALLWICPASYFWHTLYVVQISLPVFFLFHQYTDLYISHRRGSRLCLMSDNLLGFQCHACNWMQ